MTHINVESVPLEQGVIPRFSSFESIADGTENSNEV